MPNTNDRRTFLKLSAAAAGTSILYPSCAVSARSYRSNEKLNVAVIGAGGKGNEDSRGVSGENLVALCDVDLGRAAGTIKRHPQAKVYRDFRVMLDKEKLDAVVISTPDHSHAPAAVRALQMGLHVYCQKPLTHTVEEARVLRDLARQHKVATSMGNQGTGMDGFRDGVEAVRSGVIGKVREAHVWTNRPGPFWKQGIDRPAGIEAIPIDLRWDLWLGAAPHRPYAKGYAPFHWRGFWDFGTGSLGDMGCHVLNMPYMALDLDVPRRVSAEHEGLTAESAPLWSIVRFEFPARGDRPAVDLKWYDGGKMPDPKLLPGVKWAPNGSLLVGDKGMLYSPGAYGTGFKLYPEDRFREWKAPEPTLPRARGERRDQIYNEWIDFCKGGKPCLANFDYAAALTETVLLGNVAIRSREAVEWDSAALKVTNSAKANELIRKDYSYGFGIS